MQETSLQVESQISYNYKHIHFNLTCFQMLLLKTCDQVLKEIYDLLCIIFDMLALDEVLQLYYRYYNYIHRVVFLCISSKGAAKQTAWQVRSHQAIIFLIKVIIHLYGLVGWLGW